MEEFIRCLKIVDVIIEEGGYDTVRNYLASVMSNNPETYDDVLESRIHGRTVKEILNKNE